MKATAKKSSAKNIPARVDPVVEMRKALEYYKTHKDEGRALLVRAGIYTKSGRLTKAYGG